MTHSNLDLLVRVATELKPLLEDLVLVGGCATGLLITDPTAAPVRVTNDVDAIVNIASYSEYIDFGSRLRSLGFSEDMSEGAPVCRWFKGVSVLDVMPIDESILGFSNRWYKRAMDTSVRRTVSDGLTLRTITAPCFLATKLDAFKGRGKNDFASSHDLEDMIVVIDGRKELMNELIGSDGDLKKYIGEEFSVLLDKRGFHDALPGFLLPDVGSQQRLQGLVDKIKSISRMNDEFQ